MVRVSFGVAGLAARTLDPTREGYGTAIAQSLELAELAEDSGFDMVWTGEHHGATDGYMPAPLVLLGAIAARTTRIGLGTNVLLAPLWDEIRLYEEAAVVDQLSRGRLTLTMGVGYLESEYAAFGLPMASRVPRLERAVARLTGNAGDTSADGFVCTPSPFQQPGPRVWLGGFVRPAVERAGRLSSGYLGPTLGVEGLEQRIDWLDVDTLPAGFSIGVTVLGFVCADPQSVDALRAADDLGIGTGSQPTAPRPEGIGERIVALGEPDRCVTALRPIVDVLARLPDRLEAHVAMQLTSPRVSHAANCESIRLFAKEVAPELQGSSRTEDGHDLRTR
jgi:alkanesulfonate monooxygenase SsuD/methylene tetrahydromethanopterin reductase-like flavin-dependent oxidoreductase (luciferase family)